MASPEGSSRLGFLAGREGLFWVDTDDGNVPVSVEEDWVVRADPLRLLDAQHHVRLRAGDRVEVGPTGPDGKVEARALKVVKAARVRTVDVRVARLDDDGRGFGLWADVCRAARVWRTNPVLPLVSTLLAVVQYLPELARPRPSGCGVVTGTTCTSGTPGGYLLTSLLVLPVMLYGLGFYGAERHWYAELFDGHQPRTRWMLSSAWSYVGRYFRLALLIAGGYAPLVFIVDSQTSGTSRSVIITIATLLLDFALTFVTPALAFTTSTATTALGIGLRMIRTTFPANAAYLLVPPLGFSILLRLGPAQTGNGGLNLLADIVASLVTLLFAGATTLFYLRQAARERPFSKDAPVDSTTR